MIKVVVVGACGRMGKRLVTLIHEASDLELSGAVEFKESPFIGQDANGVVGLPPNGIKVTDSLSKALSGADAVIDFSTADVVEHVNMAVDAHVAIVIGTTGLPLETREQIKACGQRGRVLFTTNMSVGVNLLFHLVSEVAQRLSDDYDIEIVEMHHNQKKDAPSGTATTLAEKVAEARGLSVEKDVRHGRVGLVGARTRKEIGMHALRGGDIVGDHTVIFAANGERIELTHKASNRDTFAMGALTAVRFLTEPARENGFYDMQDVLKLK